jgi:hypothetical protein
MGYRFELLRSEWEAFGRVEVTVPRSDSATGACRGWNIIPRVFLDDSATGMVDVELEVVVRKWSCGECGVEDEVEICP